MSGTGGADPEVRFDRISRWVLFLGAAVVIAVRYPDLFLEPRLWGEEGTVYLHAAYTKPWYETIFAPALGYLCFSATIPTTIAAHWIAVEYVPAFTTGFAFALQLVPVALVVWGRARIWRNSGVRALGLAILILNPLGEEVWLTTNCLQFHFALAAFFVFLEQFEEEPPRGRWLFRSLVVAAGLSGPPPCTLSPLFAGHALWTRRKEAMIRAGLLVAITIVQLVVVRQNVSTAIGTDLRYAGLDVATVSSVVLGKTVIVPILGVDYGHSFAVLFDRVRDQGPDAVRVAGLVCLAALVAPLFYFGRRAAPAQRAAFIGAFALLTLSSLYFGIGDRKTWVHPVCAARYFYAPGVVLLLFLLAQLDLRNRVPWAQRRGWVAALLGLGIVMQASNWQDRFFSPKGQPHWDREVAEWRADPRHRLGVWPQGWAFEIPRLGGR